MSSRGVSSRRRHEMTDEIQLRSQLAFFGQSHAKAKRLRLKHFIEIVFNLVHAYGDVALKGWVMAQHSNGVFMRACVWCKKETPFYFDYCLICTEKERRIETMDTNSD